MTETDDILLDVADPEVSARFYERLLACTGRCSCWRQGGG